MTDSPRRLDVTEFNASEEVGFELPEPLEFLPTYFQPWNELAKAMPFLVEKRKFRSHILKMPLLDHGRLETYKQRRLAHLQLVKMAAGYVWQDGDIDVPKVLPACIAVPLWGISEELGLPAAISHSDMVGANYTKIDVNGPMEAENVRCLYSKPGGREAQWVVQVSVEMGANMGPCLKGIADALYCAETKDEVGLINALGEVSQAMHRIKTALSKIHERTTPETLYTVTRPFLFGWGGKGSALPDGLIFEGVSDVPKKSATGGSSLMCQVVDGMLGTEYRKGCQGYVQSDRELMPPPHRDLVLYIWERSKVRQTVLASHSLSLKQAYNDCVMSMVDFRSYHIQIVAKYVMIAGKKNVDHKFIHEAKKGGGTGGSDGMPNLKSLRESSLDCIIP